MSRRQFPRPPTAVDCAGKIFGRWQVISRAGRDGDSATWNCVEIETGREKILTRRALRCHEKLARKLSTDGKPLRPIQGKLDSERACQPGSMFGVWRVLSADARGSNRYERSWNVECSRCGSERTMAENVLRGIRAHGCHGCNNCLKTMPRLLSATRLDNGSIRVTVRTRDGKTMTGEVME